MNDDILLGDQITQDEVQSLRKDDEVEILFKVPQETIQNITLRLKISFTIEQVKKEIEKKHALKPNAAKQKIFYAGKLLGNHEVLKDLFQGVIFNL